ncbi:hypothetical protein SHI21_12545 [Bacteriovorax sp. PP10]|uniref:DUF5667 domain-containing protein n=1 Tax=Bacteriovorax antarcticus TaxID=3088717 RepID=A0ABU5VZP9_9BACT|nr:hypothetical protein [Bacteriovorax sp. PP10]MEA9357045.1 hypothetical protein [Bacteriovorax sp. PP10]
MKKILKNSILILVMQSLFMGIAFSSDRVDLLLEEDSANALDAIQVKLDQVEQLRLKLQIIDFHLAQKPTGESVYLKFERIAGAVVLSGIVAGSASIYFPPGMRAMIAANITVRGLKSGMVVLNELDANKIRTDLVLLRMKLQVSESSLKREANYYCKQVSSHSLCD